MKYYIDLAKLAVWIGLFIHLLEHNNSPFLYIVSLIAVISCIGHGVGTMFENDCIRYAEKRQEEEEEDV